MATLICTITEYHKFIGPKIRNSIQALTKKRKKELKNICQDCGRERELEAAHRRGKERKKIIEKILYKYLDKDNHLRIDLEKIDKEILSAHKPIDKHFKFLCKSCHNKYDKN